MTPKHPEIQLSGLRKKIYTIIFESNTRAGRLFDVILITAIVLSVTSVMLETVSSVNAKYGSFLVLLDWIFTVLFTIEYILRLWCSPRPKQYAKSFFGIIDLASILPLFIALIIPESRVLADIRILRLLRLFKILNLTHYMGEARNLSRALVASRRKITVFLMTILTLVIVMGSMMYLIEGPENGFTSIPTSIYWAIVTLTTVGFGDITPKTPLGQAIASFAMILGYGIIAVPTGIVTSELTREVNRYDKHAATRLCPHCFYEGHDIEAHYCLRCGGKLPEAVYESGYHGRNQS